MANIYETLAQYQYAVSVLLSDDPEAIEAAIGALTVAEADIDEKFPQLARVIRNLEADAEAVHAEKMRLDKKEKTIKNAEERIKQLVFDCMTVTGRTKVKTDIGDFRIQANPAKCVIQDVYCIPDEFLILKEPDVNKKAILEYYKKTGEIVPGTDIVKENGLRFS